MIDGSDETADAIRYALLRRLTPGIRHGLLGELQAIKNLTELAARQLQVSADVTQAQHSLSQIIAQTRNAVDSCRTIVKWLRPEAGVTTGLGDGLAQCLKLAGEAWPLRGIMATTDLQAAGALVEETTLRELFTASLIALIDTNPGALDIDVQSATEGDHIELKLHARAAEGRSSMLEKDERRFTWADVQVLAKAHGVPFSCQAHGATLRLRRIADCGSTNPGPSSVAR